MAVCSSEAVARVRSDGEKTITVVADAWCPYNCEPSSHDSGIMVDIMRQVFKEQGYDVSYRMMPWSEALESTRIGHADAVIGVSPEEAKSLILAAEPIGQNKTCLYTRADDPYLYRPGSSLQGRRLGVTLGYMYGGALDQFIEANRTQYELVQFVGGRKPLLNNYRKLTDRRIDTLVENFLVMEFNAKKYGFQDIRIAGCEEPSSLHVAFSPKRPDSGRLAEMVNDGLRSLRKGGRLKELLARYGTADWRP
jgi:polar amino acid transport system substrate-binding protein